jgi:hypothetical protein
VPTKKRRSDWKRFEYLFPEKKKLRKRDRDRFASEAAARTHRVFADVAAAQAKAQEEADREAAIAAVCKHCGDPLGLVFREIPGGWEAGLCPECGGSVFYAQPPEFMGPALRLAGPNSGWVPLAKTPAAGLSDHAAQEWRKKAVARSRSEIVTGRSQRPISRPQSDAGEQTTNSEQPTEPVPEPAADEPTPAAPEPDPEPETEPATAAPDPEVYSDGWDDDGVSGEPPPI